MLARGTNQGGVCTLGGVCVEAPAPVPWRAPWEVAVVYLKRLACTPLLPPVPG